MTRRGKLIRLSAFTAVAVLWGYTLLTSLTGSSLFGAGAASASYAYQDQYLTVFKHVINDDGGSATAGQWLLHVKSGGTEVAGSPAPGSETGTTYTLNPGTYDVTETGGPAGYFFAGYSLDCAPNGTVTISAGAASYSCKLTNNDLGPRRSAGFWKTHLDAVAPLLPVSLGNFQVTTTAIADSVFSATNCGNSKPASAVGCLAGQLLAAKLNIANGQSTCIAPTVANADALLVSIGYVGPTGTYTLTSAQRARAVQLAKALEGYNTQKSCTNP